MSAAAEPESRPSLPPAALLVLSPSGQRTRVPLEPLPFLLGRQPDNNLVLRDNRASRQHARIVAENGSYVIEDLSSRHGTWVNGERIARHVRGAIPTASSSRAVILSSSPFRSIMARSTRFRGSLVEPTTGPAFERIGA